VATIKPATSSPQFSETPEIDNRKSRERKKYGTLALEGSKAITVSPFVFSVKEIEA